MKTGGSAMKDSTLDKKSTIFRVLVLLYIIIGIAAAACKKENAVYTVRITVLNAVPDANAFDVYAGGGKLNSSGVFGIPDYNIPVTALTDSIGWRVTGRPAFDSLFIADLPNGEDFTLLFYDSATRYKPFLVRDSWQQPASTRQGYFRFFPMIINANALQITNDTGKVLMSGRSFGDFAGRQAPFSAIDSFTTKLRLYNNSILIDSLPNTHILPGQSYTLYAVGVLGATGDKRPRMILHRHE